MKLSDLFWTVAISGVIIGLDSKHYNSFTTPEHLHSEMQTESSFGYSFIQSSGSMNIGTLSSYNNLISY